MTAEEWAKKLLDEHPIEYAVGYKHHSPYEAYKAIAAAIGEAIAAEREACARLAEAYSITVRDSDLDGTVSDGICGSVSGAEVAAAIRGRS